MGTSAEEALAALARDLIEEISAGRAIELAEAWAADPDADPVELARFNVRPFQRTTTVHGRKVVENVGAHTAERGGFGAPASAGMQGEHAKQQSAMEKLQSPDITGPGLPHPGGWIPEASWIKGQAEWAAKGEAIWKANQWKAHAKLHEGIGKTASHVTHLDKTRGKEGGFIPNRFGGTDTAHHLTEAQKRLQAAREGGEGDPGVHIGHAYRHLMEAHREGTEKALPQAASKEERAHVEEGLKQIRGHLDTLDKSMGMKKGSSSKPLEADIEKARDQGRLRERLKQIQVGSTRNKILYPNGLDKRRSRLWDPPEGGSGESVEQHLGRAEQLLGETGYGPGAVADAYHHLHEAHRLGVEDALPSATKPEDKQQVREGLDAIQAHMEELDRLTGSDPKRTQQLLGGVQEQEERSRSAHERREYEKNSAPNYLAPGRKVIDPRFSATGDPGAHNGTVTRVYQGQYGPRVDLQWNDGKEGSYSLDAAKELLRPAPGEAPAPEGTFQPEAKADTGMEADLAKAKSQALVGKTVRASPDAKGWEADWASRILKGGVGVVTDVPNEIFDMGAEDWEKNTQHWVNVQVPGVDHPIALPPDALIEHQPAPPKGAEAVHPQLGSHLVRLPGDSISQRNYAHVPRPVDVPPPVPPSTNEQALTQALADANKRLAQHAERDTQRRQDQLQQNLAETRAKEMEARGIAAPGTYQPLSDAEFAHHVSQLEETISDALRNGLATDQQFALDKHGTVWDPDRAVQHQSIISSFLNQQVDVPSQHQAIMVGGPPGAGKTTMLAQHEGIRPGEYAIVNTDHFKEELVRRGMVPEVPGLSPMEASALVHEESAYLHDLAAAELQKRGKNIIFDGTMRHAEITRDRLQQLKRHGYNVGAMFVDVPVEASLEGAESRYRRGLEEYRAGRNPMGGRHVPRSVILSGETGPGRTQALDTFEALQPDFSWWEHHDGMTNKMIGHATAQQQSGGGIPSVEELRKQMEGGTYTGATEAEARAREKGTAT